MRVLSAVLTLGLSTSLLAQQPFAPKPPVDQLAWMVGEWEGPAWNQRGPERHTLRQTERVEVQSGGMTLAVRGRGFEKMTDGSERVTFEAFAMIFRERDGKIAIRAFSMEGQYIDPTIVLKPDGLIWSFADPRIGQVRYTTTHTPTDQWHETGEWSRDGATWTQFMEMTLQRKK